MPFKFKYGKETLSDIRELSYLFGTSFVVGIVGYGYSIENWSSLDSGDIGAGVFCFAFVFFSLLISAFYKKY